MLRSGKLRHWLFLTGCSALPLTGCVSGSSGTMTSQAPPQGAIVTEEPPPRKSSDPTRLPLAYAQWQEQLGNLTEARQSYEKVLGTDSKSADAILGLARVDQLSGRVFEAEQGFQKALKMRPNDPQTLDAVGQFYVAQERWSEAIPILQSASSQAPNEIAYRYHLAVALAQSGDIEGALPHFARTVGEAEAHYNVGYVLFNKGQMDAAEQHFLQAILKKPDLAEAQALYDQVRAERENVQLASGSSLSGPPASTLASRQPQPSMTDRTAQTAVRNGGGRGSQIPTTSGAVAPNQAVQLTGNQVPALPTTGHSQRYPVTNAAVQQHSSLPNVIPGRTPTFPDAPSNAAGPTAPHQLPSVTPGAARPAAPGVEPRYDATMTREQWEQMRNQQ